MRLRIATWNMGHWQQRAASGEAWRYLLEEVRPDVALVQEAVPPETLGEGVRVLWEPVPGRGGWGTGVASRGLSLQRFPLETVSHPGAVVVAEVGLPDGSEVTAVSLYGLLEYSRGRPRSGRVGY